MELDAALRVDQKINLAIGITMTLEDVDSQQARELLKRTSHTAGLTLAELASLLVEESRGLWVLEAAANLLPSLEAEQPCS